jgi:hypothetical protein
MDMSCSSRDCGTRAGSVDTWFTSPTGQVYRSKIAAARGIGLDPSRKSSLQKPSKIKSSEDLAPNNPKACGKSSSSKNKNKKSPKTNLKGALDDTLKVQANGAPRFTDLTLEEMGQLLLSMASAVDLNDCYDGLLFYKEEQLRYEARMAQRLRYKELLAEQLSMEQLPNQGLESPDDGKTELHESCAGSDASKLPISQQERLIDDCSLEVKSPNIEGAEEEEVYQGEEETNMIMLNDGRFVRRSSRNASSSKPKASNEDKSDAKVGFEVDAHTVDAMAAMVDEVEELQPPGPPCFDGWETEVELIRKCLVRVPSRLGRPASEDPQPLSPRTRDPCVIDALLSLSDADSDSSVHGSPTVSPQKCAAWVQKGFPIAQLSANGGCPTSLHPAALFYLRNLREQEEAEERAAAKRAKEKAARREAKKLEKVVANSNNHNPNSNPNSNSDSYPSSGQLPSRAALGERLRGKSIQDIESALMERLRSYVSGLGGVLPDGWKVKAAIRQQGANAGGVDAYYFDPTGVRYKSMIKVAESLGLNCANAAKAKSVAAVLKSSGQQSGQKNSQSTANRNTSVGPHLGNQGSNSKLKLPTEAAVRQDKKIDAHTANAVDMRLPLTAAEIPGSIKDEKGNVDYERKDAPVTGAPRKRPRKSGASSNKTANPANDSNTRTTKDTGAGTGTSTSHGGKHHDGKQSGNGTGVNNGGDDDDDDDDNRKRRKTKSCPDAHNGKGLLVVK